MSMKNFVEAQHALLVAEQQIMDNAGYFRDFVQALEDAGNGAYRAEMGKGGAVKVYFTPGIEFVRGEETVKMESFGMWLQDGRYVPYPGGVVKSSWAQEYIDSTTKNIVDLANSIAGL